MLPGSGGQGRPRITRLLFGSLTTAAAFLSLAAAASAATFFVEEGAGGDCTAGNPCGTIEEALIAHRAPPVADDVIEVAAGSYPENVAANDDPLDDGLLIRGELTGGGNPDTFIEGEGSSGALGCPLCIVALGAPPNIEVEMQNVEVNQDSTDFDADLTPVFLEGGSDLQTVDVEAVDEGTFAGVELCVDPGTTFEDVVIDVIDADSVGISGCAAVSITDTAVFTDSLPALDVGASPAETTEITRSWLSAADDSLNPVASVSSGLELDSSLVTGGSIGVEFLGADGQAVDLNNATIDPADPGDEDGQAIFLGRQGSDPFDVTLDSTIAVGTIYVDDPGAPMTLTCEYSNFAPADLSLPPDMTDFTDNCPPARSPGSTNTDTDPDDLFEDPFFGNWSLQAGSPAIDGGMPGPVPMGFSNTDIDGDPRRLPGTAATCPDPVRDQGAFEAPANPCTPPSTQRTLSVSTSGTGSGTVTGPGIDCGAGRTDCSETVAAGSTIELTASAVAGSSFDGFTGGGCSASPCTVTLDTDKSVQARFTGPGDAGLALRVELAGPGRGLVTGPGIDCGNAGGHGVCTAIYPRGTQVTLTATPEPGSEFATFTGAGCGTGPCTVTMDAAQTVTAGFDHTTSPLTTFDKRPRSPWPRRPVFKLSSSERNSTFECRVDTGAWDECGSRVKLRGLNTGQHRFRARATADGVTGPPTSDRFRIPR